MRPCTPQSEKSAPPCSRSDLVEPQEVQCRQTNYSTQTDNTLSGDFGGTRKGMKGRRGGRVCVPMRQGPRTSAQKGVRHQLPTAIRRQPPPTANRQLPTANHRQPPTIIQYGLCGFVHCPCLDHVPVDSFLLSLQTLFFCSPSSLRPVLDQICSCTPPLCSFHYLQPMTAGPASVPFTLCRRRRRQRRRSSGRRSAPDMRRTARS